MAIDLDVHGNTRPLESAVQAAVNRIRRKPIKIIVDDKGATQPLGNMKRGADEFSKSMEAANARILAFGASMAIINGVGNAFKQMVGNVIEVEKALADINVVMGLSTQKLEEFSDGLFKAAKETGQAFKIASNAAVEYARQGLGVEESLKRTRDALILTRLTGMESAEAVKALTAAMNTYGSQIDDTTQLVSKFAAVDVQFAVSAEDFADAIARTGQSAKSAGVDIDELIGIVTAAQQQTARGGKVIGNSLKTIFTRIGRTDTLNQLENLGIAVRDVEGNTLGATRILTDLANTFDHLSEAQKSQIAQTVGGVFQINILKAVLSDAAKQNGILARATDISSNATDEAIQKNDELRNTFSALATETGLALKEMSVAIGEVALAPGMEKILNTFKSFAEGANELLGEGESAGSKFANGFLAGLGNILTGPGLVVLTAVFFKLFGSAVKFTKESLTSLMGITTEAQKQKAIQTSLVTLFSQNAELGERMLRTDISRTEKEKIILGLIKAQVAEAKMLNTVAQQAASTLYRQGFGANLTPRKNKATGHIPNFASKNSTRGKREQEEARESGYSAGAIRSQALPGEGLITYNTAETIKKFPGIKETAIMPPMQSKAGEKYKTGFEEIHGFDPYEAGGLATNFGSRNQKTVPLERIRKLSQSKEVDKRQSSNLISPAQTFQSGVEQSGSKNQRTPPKERTAQTDESGSKNQTSAPQDRAVEQPGSKNQKLTPKTLDQGELQVGSKNQRTPPKERTEQAVEPGSKNQTSAPQDRAVEQPGSKNQKLTPRARREDITEMGSKNQISKPQERQVQTDESGSKNQTTPARERQVEQPGSQNQVKPIDPKAANQTQNFNTILNNKILPQAESIDGNNYKQAFEKINGFNPYVSKSIFSDTVSGMGGVGPQVAARKNIEKQDATSIEDKIIKSGSKNQTTPPEERIFEGPQKGSKNQNQEPDDRRLEIEKTGSKNQILTPKKQTEAISEIGSKNQTTETVPLERDFEMQKRGSKNQTTEPEDRRFETKEIGSKNQRKSPAFKIRPAKEFKLDQEPKNYPNPETKDGERYKMGFMSLNKNDPYRAKSKVSNFSYEDEEKEKNKPKYALGFIPNFYQGSRNQRWTPKERQPDDENIFEAMGFAGAGLVPDAAQEERSQALKAGYAPGAVKTMRMPGEGQVYYNSAEQVKTFPGMSQPAIMPPAQSRAGKVYQQEFSNQHGFDPYAAEGYIPNYAIINRDKKMVVFAASMERGGQYAGINDDLNNIFSIKPKGKGFSHSSGPEKKDGFSRVNVPYFGISGKDKQIDQHKDFQSLINARLMQAGQKVAGEIATKILGKNYSVKTLEEADVAAASGNVFEAAIMALQSGVAKEARKKDPGGTALLDIPRAGRDKLWEVFGAGGFGGLGAEAKIALGGAKDLGSHLKSAAEKFYKIEKKGENPFAGGKTNSSKTSDLKKGILSSRNGALTVMVGKEERAFNSQDSDQIQALKKANFIPSTKEGRFSKTSLIKQLKNAADGYIPNFANPLSDAINREKHAGVPVSQIRVDSHAALVNRGNPLGLGVTNTRDEPNGLRDVFGANGFVPNYAENFQFARNHVNISGRNFSAQDKLVEKLNRRLKAYIKKFKAGEISQKQLNDGIARLSRRTKDQASITETATRQVNKSIKIREKLNAKMTRASMAFEATSTGRLTKSMGQRFSGNAGMMMMMGAPMAAGYLQSGGAGQTGGDGYSYVAGGGLTGAATGAMMASMFAPMTGPFAPLVIGIGALAGGIHGLMSANEENTKALREKTIQEHKEAADKRVQAITSPLGVMTQRLFDPGKVNFESKASDINFAGDFAIQDPVRRKNTPNAELEHFMSGGERQYKDREDPGFMAQGGLELAFQNAKVQSSLKKMSIDYEEDSRGDFVEFDRFWDTKYGSLNRFATDAESISSYKDYESFKKAFDEGGMDNTLKTRTEKIIKNMGGEDSGKSLKIVFEAMKEVAKSVKDTLSPQQQADRITSTKSQTFDPIKQLEMFGLQEGASFNEVISQFANKGIFGGDQQKILAGKEILSNYLDLAPDDLEIKYKDEKNTNVTQKAGDLKEKLDKLDEGNLEEIKRILQGAGIQVTALSDAYKKNKEAVILQLNLQKVMIASQQAAKDAQFAIKEKFLKQNTMLDLQEKMLSGFLNEETKARIKYTKSLNKISEAYDLGSEAAKRGFKTGIIDDLSKSTTSTQQSIRQALFNKLTDKEKEEYRKTDDIKEGEGVSSSVSVFVMNKMLEKMNNKELEEFLESIKASQTEINLILDKRKSLLTNQNSDLKKTRDSATNILDLEKAINDVINGRKDQMKEVNRELDKYIQGLDHAAKMRDLNLEGMDIEFSKGGFKTTPEKIEYEKSKLPMKIKGVREQYEKMGIDRISGLNKEYGLGMTQDQIIEASKNPSALMSESGEPVYTSARIEASRALLKTTDYAPQEAKDIGDKISQSEQRLQGFKDKKGELVFAEPNEEIVSTLEKTNKKIEEEEAALQKLKERQEDLNKTLEDRSQREKELLEAQNDLNGKIQNAVHARKNENDQLNEKIKNIKEAIKAQEEEWERMTGPDRFAAGLKEGGKKLREDTALIDYSLTEKIPGELASGLAQAMKAGLEGAEDIGDVFTQIGINFFGMIRDAMLQKAAGAIVGGIGQKTGWFNEGGKVNSYSNGGQVRRYSSGGSVPSMISNGEYIMGRDAVNRYGTAFMHNMNVRGNVNKFNSGGIVQEDVVPITTQAIAGPQPGSAIAENFGGGRGYASGRAYQQMAMSGAFYGRADNVGLQEDGNEMMDILREEERQRQEAERKRQEKKARRKQLLMSIAGSIIGGAVGGLVDGAMNGGFLTEAGKAGGYAKDTPMGTRTAIHPDGHAVSFAKGATIPSTFTNIQPVKTWNPFASMSFWNPFSSKSSAPTANTRFGVTPRSTGGKINAFASGGWVSGASGIDQIPAMLSNGEYVIKASSARAIGKPMLDNINAGKFNEGGAVSPVKESSEATSSGGNTNNINISINMAEGSSGKGSSEESEGSAKNSSEHSESYKNNKEMAEKIKMQVVNVIMEEQRPGGLLHENNRDR